MIPVTSNVTTGSLFFITFNATSKEFRVKGIDNESITGIKFYKDSSDNSIIIVRSGVFINYESMTHNDAAFNYIDPPTDTSQYTEITVS